MDLHWADVLRTGNRAVPMRTRNYLRASQMVQILFGCDFKAGDKNNLLIVTWTLNSKQIKANEWNALCLKNENDNFQNVQKIVHATWQQRSSNNLQLFLVNKWRKTVSHRFFFSINWLRPHIAVLVMHWEKVCIDWAPEGWEVNNDKKGSK